MKNTARGLSSPQQSSTTECAGLDKTGRTLKLRCGLESPRSTP